MTISLHFQLIGCHHWIKTEMHTGTFTAPSHCSLNSRRGCTLETHENVKELGFGISRKYNLTTTFHQEVALTSQQHASVSQGRICSDKFTCCHTETEAADHTFHLTQSQYTDTGPTSPSTDPKTPGAWQGSHWSANFSVTGITRPRKNLVAIGISARDIPLSRRAP